MNIAILPRPESCEANGQVFALEIDTPLVVDPAIPEATRVALTLQARLRSAIGFTFPIESAAERGAIRLDIDSGLGASAYRLLSHDGGVEIAGGDAAGLFHGTQTLLQLCPPAILRQAPVPGTRWEVAGAEIHDRPRFEWRGFLMDTSRHFFGKNEVLKLLDALALHRMNVLHLHLTDDQGWRIEIEKYPLLTEVGAWRAGATLTEAQPGEPDDPSRPPTDYGGFYTKDDLREIVAYAAERHIKVIPEIDVPGHSQAAIAAYPWLGNVEEPLTVWTKWSVNRHVLNVDDRTIDFYRDVLDEVMEIFPSHEIHIGGDECLKTEWIASPAAQTRMRELGLADEEELQSWFIHQLADHIAARGRRPVGWDEILQGGAPEGALVMAWQDEGRGVAAVAAGHEVVMTPIESSYLYRVQGPSVLDGPGADPPLTLREVYDYDVLPAGLAAADAARVLGAQCAIWTEFVTTPRELERLVFPRLCAFAEAVWRSERSTFDDFTERLRVHVPRLQALDLDVHQRSLAGGSAASHSTDEKDSHGPQ